MTTFGDLINEVYLALEGWGLNQGRAAFLNEPTGMTASELTFDVDNADNLGEGVAEIEDELIYIQSVTGTTVTIAPDGRGYRGTTAATHADNTRVTMNPALPKIVVKQKINDTIQGVYPVLRGKGSTTIAYTGAKTTYELPATLDSVIQVTYDAVGPTGQWPQVYHYRVDLNADTTAYTTGKSITFFGGVEQGRNVRVTYLKKPTALSALGDLLTATGLADTARSVIVAGAIWRLSSYIAAARLRVDSVAIDMMDEQNKVDSGNRVAAYLRAQYEVELTEERKRQELSQPPTMNVTG